MKKEIDFEKFRKVYRYLPDQPDVKKIVRRRQKKIIINLAAREGANIIKMLW